MDELSEMKKKLKKEFEKEVEVKPDSDLPVREPVVSPKKLKKVSDFDEEEDEDDEMLGEEE